MTGDDNCGAPRQTPAPAGRPATAMNIRNVHPFPARMAPELALSSLADLPANSLVLDPMSGSGTVLRQAIALGHRAIGFDMDPLAVLMSRVWTSSVDSEVIESELRSVVEEAEGVDLRSNVLPWQDQETKEFVRFWFDDPQRRALARLAAVLHRRRTSRLGEVRHASVEVLQIALSRIIVTKEQGASLARDTSHSRPHRVAEASSYDVTAGFVRSAEQLGRRLVDHTTSPSRVAQVELGDARAMPLADRSVDAIMTSPPYLNAIDYMRGHRMSLVWLGYSLKQLRAIRSTTIGAERKADVGTAAEAKSITDAMCDLADLEPRQRGMVERYAADLRQMMAQSARVLKTTGRATYVVGNSCLKDAFIRNSDGVARAGELAGLTLVGSRERELPAGSRYLPMTAQGSLSKRMRTETVLTFQLAKNCSTLAA